MSSKNNGWTTRYDGAFEHGCGFIDDTGDHFWNGVEYNDDRTGCPDCDQKAENEKYATWEPDAQTLEWLRTASEPGFESDEDDYHPQA